MSTELHDDAHIEETENGLPVVYHHDGPVWDIDEVHPYANNPKEHPEEQIQTIRSSIKNYGWDQAIVVDEEGEIIKGHGRRLAAKSLGLEKVPVTVRDDMTDAEKQAARLADNKSAESDWSDDLLESELSVLEDTDIDIGSLGFDEDEVDDLLGPEPEDNSVDDPEVKFATELLEENNYVVFQFDNKLDWQVICDSFGIETKKALDSEGEYVQKGVGRVLNGQELLDLL